MVHMPDINNIRPQTPLEGPPLPKGTNVKWYDDPEKVFKAVSNYATQMQNPTRYHTYELGLYHFGPPAVKYSSSKRSQMVNNFIGSQQIAIDNYREWLTNKVHNL